LEGACVFDDQPMSVASAPLRFPGCVVAPRGFCNICVVAMPPSLHKPCAAEAGNAALMRFGTFEDAFGMRPQRRDPRRPAVGMRCSHRGSGPWRVSSAGRFQGGVGIASAVVAAMRSGACAVPAHRRICTPPADWRVWLAMIESWCSPPVTCLCRQERLVRPHRHRTAASSGRRADRYASMSRRRTSSARHRLKILFLCRARRLSQDW
jgi:hypothetical protein